MHNSLDVLETKVTHLHPTPHISKTLKLVNICAGSDEELVAFWDANSGGELHALQMVKGCPPLGDDCHIHDQLGVLVRS